MTASIQPLVSARQGNISIGMWNNKKGDREWKSVTISKSYYSKKKGGYGRTSFFTPDDVPNLVAAVQEFSDLLTKYKQGT
jgi:hypothetical protein